MPDSILTFASILHNLINLSSTIIVYRVEIQRDNQLDYLMNGLRQLGPSFASLDAKYVSFSL